MRPASPTTTFLVTTALALTAALAPACRADYWVTVNPDGTVTRTEVTAPPTDEKDKKPDQATDKTTADRTFDKTGAPVAGQAPISTVADVARASRVRATYYGQGTGVPTVTGQTAENGRRPNSRGREESGLSTRPSHYGQYYPTNPGYYYPNGASGYYYPSTGYYPGTGYYPSPGYYPSYPGPAYQQPYSIQLPTSLGGASPWITSIPGPTIVQTPGYYCPPPAYGPAYPPPVAYCPPQPAYPAYPGYDPYPYGYRGAGGVYGNSTGAYGNFSFSSGGVNVRIGGSRQTTTTTTTTSGFFGR